MTGTRPQRWCIYIDILGFSELWEKEQMKALRSLRELMQAVYRIGTRVYAGKDEDERIFVHHMGDGFAIISDFGEESLERPISIAIALMRCVASVGTFAGAAIAEGDNADITGCYPAEVVDASENRRVVALGAGHMTLFSVMGTAFIRAYRLSHDSLSGPLLVIPSSYRDRVHAALPVRAIASRNGTPLLSINWVRAALPRLLEIQERAGLSTPTPDALVRAIQTYCKQYAKPREKWRHIYDLLEIEACSEAP